MRKKQLIEMLSEYDDDCEVFIQNYEDLGPTYIHT